jgi:hypothetical protein
MNGLAVEQESIYLKQIQELQQEVIDSHQFADELEASLDKVKNICCRAFLYSFLF